MRPASPSLRRMCAAAVLGVLLLSLLACGSGGSEEGGITTINLALVIPSTETSETGGRTTWWARVWNWLPSADVAWGQVSQITRLKVDVLASDGAVLATETVPLSNPAPGQVVPLSLKAPSGPNRTISVSAFDGSGAKLYSGSTTANLTPDATIPLQITLLATIIVTVQKQGAGAGTVLSTPAGIDCGGTCSARFDAGTIVTLTATAAPGSSFGEWSGGGCGGTGPCTVSATVTVTARFDPVVSGSILTVTLAGTGTGTVSSSPSGIACLPTCTASYDTGTSVTLTAVPGSGSTFAGWSGACSGTAVSCIVAMNGDRTVTAQFAAAPATSVLTVVKMGGGSGTVTSNPGGINCGNTCSASFSNGSSVMLTATATGGASFAGWGGACSGTGACTVTMNGNQTVTATFNAPIVMNTLSLNFAGTGGGRVTSQPAGIDCTADCSAGFPAGTGVTLTASPSGGSTFAGWSGSGCSGTGSCTVTMNANQSVTATFTAPPATNTLTVNRTGTGAASGTVTSQPAGINCGATCSANFTAGSQVILTATASGGATFTGWSGGGCSGTATCTVTMSGNVTVAANFTAPVATNTLTVAKLGTGTGTVTSTPSGINCGTTCSAPFPTGTSVTLTATQAIGSSFGGWSDPACGGNPTCTVTVLSDQTVTATFNLAPGG